MKSDVYTKIMLAVIALNLTILTGVNLKPLTSEKVDKGPTEVVITGAKINSGSNVTGGASGDVLVDILGKLRTISLKIGDLSSAIKSSDNQPGPIEVDIRKVGGYDLGNYSRNWNMPSIPVEVRY
jgi:hypothetical protein